MNQSKLSEIFSALFFIAPNQIIETLSQDTVPRWDSLQHLNLILAIEEAFEIQLSPADIARMTNLKVIKEILREKGVVFEA